jgi:hypothetical protein
VLPHIDKESVRQALWRPPACAEPPASTKRAPSPPTRIGACRPPSRMLAAIWNCDAFRVCAAAAAKVTISTNVAGSPLAAPCILQWLRAHGDILGRVRHAGVPMSFWSLQASIPPLACTVPVVCRKQCGCTGKSISALRPAVAIILLTANRLNCSPRSLVKMYERRRCCP